MPRYNLNGDIIEDDDNFNLNLEDEVSDNKQYESTKIDIKLAPQIVEVCEERNNEILISLEGVDIVNGGNLVLSNVNFKVRRGEFVYLVGRVGSGKSSIIKSIICEIPLLSGQARVFDYDLIKIKKKQIPFLRRNIGVVFQDFQLLMDRSVEENLMFVLLATGWNKQSEMLQRVKEVLTMVGMESKSHKMPHQLSGGEQQRIVIARALLNNPSIILADEPTGNLDVETAMGIMDLFMKIHREHNPAIVMVTHNRDLFKKYPGRVMVCDNSECKPLQLEMEEIILDDLLR